MKLETKKIRISLLLIIGILAGSVFYLYTILSSGFDIKSTVYIYINESHNYSQLLNDIQTMGKAENIADFEKIASFLDYPQNMKPGRYAIKPGMTVYQLAKVLRKGRQTPVRLTFNNIRTKDELVKQLSSQLMLSDTTLLATLNDSVRCAQFGFTPQTIVGMFIPNTYEVYWNIGQADS